MPGCAGVVQTLTLGTPFTFIKQFGQFPVTHSSPRGRWCLKLRVKTRTPARNIAAPMLSPTRASITLPLKTKEKFSLVCAKVRFLLTVGKVSSNYTISTCVAHRLQPLSTPKTVIPPFGLYAHLVAAHKTIAIPRVLVRTSSRAGENFAAKTKLVGASLTALGTGNTERHVGENLSFSCVRSPTLASYPLMELYRPPTLRV